MNKSIKVKKLWSLNPTQYKEITLKQASNDYAEWLDSVIDRFGYYDKDFVDWLETEI